MILCDTAPLVALVSPEEPSHPLCKEIFRRYDEPLLTTWVCFGEAMYLVGREGRWDRQRLLWGFVEGDLLSFHPHSNDEVRRMLELMTKYRSRPMDLADASLVTAAETLGTNRIFSLDSDFLIYLLHDTTPFDVVR